MFFSIAVLLTAIFLQSVSQTYIIYKKKKLWLISSKLVAIRYHSSALVTVILKAENIQNIIPPAVNLIKSIHTRTWHTYMENIIW